MTMREHFLEGMSKVAATVSIVTTYSTKGRQGATVSAMSSVSADTPNPTLLICIKETSATAEAIRASGVFCVNVLQNSQAHISDRFARTSQTLDNDKFSCADWNLDALGSPQIVGGLVAFSCILSSWQKVGTHVVLFGDVKDVVIANEGSPLIYLHRLYSSAVPIYGPPQEDHARPDAVGSVAIHAGTALGVLRRPEQVKAGFFASADAAGMAGAPGLDQIKCFSAAHVADWDSVRSQTK